MECEFTPAAFKLRQSIISVVQMHFTAIVEKEGAWYVARAAEFEIASQGKSIEAALDNLKEAISLYLKHAEPAEIKAIEKRHGSLLIASIEVRA